MRPQAEHVSYLGTSRCPPESSANILPKYPVASSPPQAAGPVTKWSGRGQPPISVVLQKVSVPRSAPEGAENRTQRKPPGSLLGRSAAGGMAQESEVQGRLTAEVGEATLIGRGKLQERREELGSGSLASPVARGADALGWQRLMALPHFCAERALSVPRGRQASWQLH